MTKKYKILSHTADLRLEVFGKTIEELFKNSAEALTKILSPKTIKSGTRNQELVTKVSIESANINTLLVDFLNEILAKSQINKSVYELMSLRVDEDKIKVEAELTGVPVSEFEEDVKAVTYHEVDIKKELGTRNKGQGVWKTKLVIDI